MQKYKNKIWKRLFLPPIPNKKKSIRIWHCLTQYNKDANLWLNDNETYYIQKAHNIGDKCYHFMGVCIFLYVFFNNFVLVIAKDPFLELIQFFTYIIGLCFGFFCLITVICNIIVLIYWLYNYKLLLKFNKYNDYQDKLVAGFFIFKGIKMGVAACVGCVGGALVLNEAHKVVHGYGIEHFMYKWGYYSEGIPRPPGPIDPVTPAPRIKVPRID